MTGPKPASSFRPAHRLAQISVSEILQRSGQAAALKRAGRPMIILGAGEPDFDTPDHIKAAAQRAIWDGETKYTALDGSAELKAAVRAKFERENGLTFSPREITCGTGAKQILYNALMATLDAGDEVLIPTPYWTSYADMVAIAGGVVVEMPCEAESRFRLTPAQLEAAITDRTRWVILNSPSNPSGTAYDREELAALAEVLRRHKQVWVLCDDIYEHIVYDGFQCVPFARVAPDLASRILIVNGVSKAYAMTGWRLGYGAGPEALIGAMAIVQSQSTSCPSSVSQAAAIAALTGPQDFIPERAKSFERRRDLVVAGLNAVPGIRCDTPRGAFYVYAGCAGLMGRRTTAGLVLKTDRDLADYLMDHDVAVIPGSCFGLAPYLRLSYATSEAELTEALRRIKAACAALS